MASKVVPFYKKKHISQISTDYRSLHSKRVVKTQQMVRKSTCTCASQGKAQATEVMAEPAYTVPEFRQRSTEEVSEYQRVSTHVEKGLAAIQEELHRMRMATKVQVDNLATQRELKEKMSKKVDLYEEGDKLPDFLVALRSHTVWEKTPV
ncbi:hypothetical protein CRUP_001082 [Coryphaenoides rupestris]|nr:hypothetical protein CRUP_001082 [Coryphaenoides rupestris]